MTTVPLFGNQRLMPEPVELASGVDALYLSDCTALPLPLLDRLEKSRTLAELTSVSVPFDLGAVSFRVAPYAFDRPRTAERSNLRCCLVFHRQWLPAPVAAIVAAFGRLGATTRALK